MAHDDENVYEIHRYGRVKPAVQNYVPPQLPMKFEPDMSTTDLLEIGHFKESIQHFAMIDLQDNLHRLNYIHQQLKAMLVELETLVQK